MSRKQEIYQEMLELVLPYVRNVCAQPWWRRAISKRGYFDIELVHNIPQTILVEEFTMHDIWFLNNQAKWYFESSSKRSSAYYGELTRLLRELFDAVPDQMRSNLEWSGPLLH